MAPTPKKQQQELSDPEDEEEEVLERGPADIARDICAALKDVYYDSSKPLLKKRTADLIKMYTEECETAINRDEYLEELCHRCELFIEGTKSLDGQIRVFRLFAVLACRILKDFGDSSVLDQLLVAIHKKKYNKNPVVRCGTVALIGRIVYTSIVEPPKSSQDDESFFASFLPEETFADLYSILWDLSADEDENVRVGVLIAIERIQSYPGLMEAVDTTQMETSKQLFVLGMRDPSEQVRCQAVRGLKVNTNHEARLFLDTLIHDDSETVRLKIAEKLSTEVPVTFFSKGERMTLLKCRHLFLADSIIPEYYEILRSWSADLYCLAQGMDFDTEISPSQTLDGMFSLLDSFILTKDVGQIFLRLFEHLRTKFIQFEGDGSYLRFAHLFCYDETPYLTFENFDDFHLIDDNNTGLAALNVKAKKAFIWQLLAEYCCHLSLPEAVRIDCRSVFFPTMADFATFIRKAWETLKAGGENEKNPRVKILQNICARALLKIFHNLDRDDIGMFTWKELLEDLFMDYSFKYDSDLILLMVHDYFYYHCTHQDARVHEMSDLMTRIADMEQKVDCTQDLMAEESQFNTSQNTHCSEFQVSNISPPKRKRCVEVFAAAFKNGLFLQPSPVLEGLLTDYAAYTFDNPVDSESKKAAFICIAGMVPLIDQDQYNFIKSCRIILESHEPLYEDIKNIAVMLIYDAICAYDYFKVNQWYYAGSGSENEIPKNKLLKQLIKITDGKDTFSTFAVRILLRLIIFDYDRVFHEAFVHLLIKLFTPGEDGRLKRLLVHFFTTYCHYSRENQCVLAHCFADAVMKLSNVSLDSPLATVDLDEMADFVLNVTAFKALDKNALEREQGTAHLFLVARLLRRLEKLTDDRKFAELIASMISKCEVSEVYDEETFNSVKQGVDRMITMMDKNKIARYLNAYFTRLESAQRYAASNKAIERPEIEEKTLEEREKELTEIANYLKSITEEVGKAQRPWLPREERREEQEEEDDTDEEEEKEEEGGILSKMKIYGELDVNIDEILKLLTSKDSPLFQAGPESLKVVPAAAPASSSPRKRSAPKIPAATPRSRMQKIAPPSATRPTRRRPLIEKLMSVPEEDFAD